MKKLIFILVPLISGSIFAKNDHREPIVIGERLSITSEILDEDRTLWVHLPANYDHSGQKYPVMVLLDGGGHFHHVTGIIQFLSRINRVPQMIVVGLPNTDRTRDLTPPRFQDTTSTFPTAGGANNFLKFISDELIPFVEQNYRTHPYRVLVGHSFGGLFAVNALLTKPDVFDAYISISPTLWWDNQRLLGDTEDLLKSHSDFDKFLFCSLGNEGDRMQVPAEEFVRILQKHAPESFRWDFRFMENEDHGSTPHRTIYDGLEALYVDWRLPREVAQNGSLDDFDRHYAELSKKFGYEIETPENVVNRLGYRLLAQKEIDEAIRLFKRNVERYPESANVYDSLGDAYDANGQFELAKKNYEIAYKKAQATSHPNVKIYKNNFERLQKKLADSTE
ncbi:hypothetical protein GWO43_17000 [candidate division KSB1 bacterium]|nr:hypothetical protein [candidate division KSB1 bacterium]NIR69161.1 hypothetical protein [candidate division KSB1 bacterium]NIS25672.1 hypothetical protein [candidate division KSB1 bacterium]NIT72540.1 hypothetical protein [candidate division KSB1 bacterium]NIU26349.1 hypothetical protein [candidate division KSB1 bacterium]